MVVGERWFGKGEVRVRVRLRVRLRVRVRDGAHLPVGHHVLAAEEAQQRGLARAVGACSG